MKNPKILASALYKYVEEKQIEKIRIVTDNFHPKDLYEIIKDWDIATVMILIRSLKQEQASELFDEFSVEQQKKVIDSFSKKEISDLFEQIHTDETIDILEELPAKIVRKILESVTPKTKNTINKLLKFDDTSVGFHMNVDFVTIQNNLTISAAKEEIKKKINNENKEIVGQIFINDENGKYIGYIKADDILSEKDKNKVSKLTTIVDPINSNDYIGSVEEHLLKYEVTSVAVVDSQGKQIGAIEVDDVLERATNASSAWAGSALTTTDIKPYKDIKVLELFKKRFFWIIILIFAGTLTQITLTGFQALWSNTGFWTPEKELGNITLTTIVTLAFSTAISVAGSINDSSGNAGSQTASTLVRSMALGEIKKEDFKNVIWKETSVGFLIGAVSGLAAILRTFLVWAIFGYFNNITGEIFMWLFVIAGITAISFMFSIILGNVIGVLIPISLALWTKYDPAIVSGPILTTIIDIVTFAFYLGLISAIFVPLANSGYFGDPPTESFIWIKSLFLS